MKWRLKILSYKIAITMRHKEMIWIDDKKIKNGGKKTAHRQKYELMTKTHAPENIPGLHEKAGGGQGCTEGVVGFTPPPPPPTEFSGSPHNLQGVSGYSVRTGTHTPHPVFLAGVFWVTDSFLAPEPPPALEKEWGRPEMAKVVHPWWSHPCTQMISEEMKWGLDMDQWVNNVWNVLSLQSAKAQLFDDK